MAAKKKTARSREKAPGREKRRGIVFPAPGPQPKLYEPRDEADRARLQNALYEWEMSGLIHRAVHVNDPRAREDLASRVSWFLIEGFPLGIVTRRWLSWVLSDLRLRDAIPHLARGNAHKVNERVDFVKQLVVVIADLADGPISPRLKQAARIMNVSYEKVRAAYYSDTYRSWEFFLRNPPPQ